METNKVKQRCKNYRKMLQPQQVLRKQLQKQQKNIYTNTKQQNTKNKMVVPTDVTVDRGNCGHWNIKFSPRYTCI